VPPLDSRRQEKLVMSTATRLSLISAVAVFAAIGCTPPTNLNVVCTLVKKTPDGGSGSVFITEGDISANASRDVISFGAVECEDLVCVREGGAPLSGNAGQAATGWCSRPCLETQANACPSNDPALDKNPATAFSCRKLLLDEAALASLKTADPGAYKKYFGDTTSPFFCARNPVVTTNP
jgi:hypothetical protein